jgi:hypothetical protein
MNSQLQALSDQIFDIKEKCSDAEYKNLMDTMGKLHAAQSQPPRQNMNAHYIENDGDSDDEIDAEIDAEIKRQAQILFDKPFRGTKEWMDLPLEQKAKWCNMTAEQYKQNEISKPHWIDIAYYKKYPESVPEHMKNHKMLVDQQSIQQKQQGCIIC